MAYVGPMTQTTRQATPATIDTARTGDDLCTALASIPAENWTLALQGRRGAAWLRIMREACDLQGASYADTMTARECAAYLVANF